MDLQNLISNQTDVSFSLARHLIAAEAKGRNFVFCPLSIHVVLGLIAAGSDGPALDELLGFLQSKSPDALHSLSSEIVNLMLVDCGSLGGPRLSFANGVWFDKSFNLKPKFKEIVDDVYKAASSSVDFQTKAGEVITEVNTWVNKETRGLIKTILESGSLDSSTKLVLANAVYFKGAWGENFDESNTKTHEFFLLNGSSVQAPFMTSWNKQYVCKFDGFKVLRLPYKQGQNKRNFSMYLFLPETKNGLPALVEKFCSESRFFDRHLPYRRVEVGDFRIPKFNINFSFEASESLKGMGLKSPFAVGGLTEMVDSSMSSNLSVSSIIHKSFIQVNEEGTEAAAATAAVIVPLCFMTEDKQDFVADHPFLFAVREDTTGAVLIIGHVLNPLDS